jgi:hypothetical protein
MAQKILIRRGGIGNIGSTIAVTKGELLYASGSTGGVENVVFVANATSNNTFTAVGQLYTGTASPTSFSARLDGLPYYKSDSKALYRLGNGTALDLSGNLEGTTVSSMTITTLTNTTLNGGTANFSGNITGSNMLLSGNANINGNIVLGGSITIGDANTDNISLGGEFTSNLIPDADDTYALGSPTRRWNIYGVDSSISGSFSGSFFGDGSGLTGLVSSLSITDGTNSDSVDLLTDTLTFATASVHGFSLTVSDNKVTLGTPQDLRTTATADFADVTIDVWGSVSASLAALDAATSAMTLQDVTDNGSTTTNNITAAGFTADNIQIGITGGNEIDTTSGNLTIDSAGGTVIIDDNLTVNGATVTLSALPAGTDNTVLVLNASNQVVTDEIDSRVWGTSLVDGTGTANQLAFWSDSNTITGDTGLTFNGTTDVLTVGTSTFGTVTNIANTLSASAVIYAPNIGTGEDNSVVVLDSDGTLRTDEIDSRVWGTSLLDGGAGLTAGRVPYVSDANTLADDAGLTYNAGTDVLTVGTSTFGTNVTVAGNLTVQGTTTTVDSTTVNIGDNIIVLNTVGTVADGGIQVIDNTSTTHTGSLLWNATNDYWYAGISGSTHYRVTTYASATPTTNNIQKVDANKRLVDSNIADTGTQIDLSVDLDMNNNDIVGVNSITISGLTANAFVHTNGSSVLSTVAPTTAGDLFQWNGSAFVASNVIDGGTF